MNQRQYFNKVAPKWDSISTEGDSVRLASIVGELGLKSDETILDVGAGTGALIPLIQEVTGNSIRLIPLDISENMLQLARGKCFDGDVNFIQADACAVPLARESCNMVICHSVFPHFVDKQRTLAELKRVLRPNSRLVICHTKSREEINEIHQNIGGAVAHAILPDEAEMRTLLADIGLERIEVSDEQDKYLAIAHQGDSILTSDLKIARDILEAENLSFVIVKEGKELARSKESGVRPFFQIIASHGQTLRGATVADQIVGKAIAMICIYAGIEEVYASLISRQALSSLGSASIPTNAIQVVSHIANRDGTDICPFEKLIHNISNPDKAFSALKAFFEDKDRCSQR